ncbi:MAG TPA: hypothetical protein VGN34_21495 [Ktedonobacteraceae bacterium]|jgi:hypothetical protein
MQQRTDADLVMLACTGTKDASDELVRRYQVQAKRIALKIVGQEEPAYESTQEAFLAAYLCTSFLLFAGSMLEPRLLARCQSGQRAPRLHAV